MGSTGGYGCRKKNCLEVQMLKLEELWISSSSCWCCCSYSWSAVAGGLVLQEGWAGGFNWRLRVQLRLQKLELELQLL